MWDREKEKFVTKRTVFWQERHPKSKKRFVLLYGCLKKCPSNDLSMDWQNDNCQVPDCLWLQKYNSSQEHDEWLNEEWKQKVGEAWDNEDRSYPDQECPK
jgi:hypothetical protein